MAGFLVNAAAKQIDAGNIAANAVGSSALQDNAVTTAKIDPLAITLAKIAAAAQAGFLDPLASTLALVLAETNSNVQGFVGDFYLADDFESDSLATKTNATYDATGDYYGNPGTPSEVEPNGTVFGNMTGQGGLAAAFDNNTNQTTAQGAYLSGSNNYVGKSFTTGQNITQVKVYAASDNYGFGGLSNATTITIYGKTSAPSAYNDGTVIGSEPSFTPAASQIKTIACNATTAYTHVWAAINQNNDTACAELEYFVAGTPINMTLAPTATTLTTANPTDLSAWIVINPQEVITAGTDIVMTASIDGGTTDATGSWTKVGDITADGRELWRVDFDVSAQTGSSLTWEITTANNKEIRLNQLVGIKAFY